MATTINGDGEIGLGGTSSSQGTLKLYEDTDNGTNYVGLQAPASIASNTTFTLPSADGTADQVLTTNGSGVLSFADAGGGAWEYISSATASTSANLTFTGLSSTYSCYAFQFVQVRPESDGYELVLRTSSDGVTYASTSGDYAYATSTNSSANTSVGTANDGGTATYALLVNNGVGNAANERGFSGFLYLWNPAALQYTSMNFSAVSTGQVTNTCTTFGSAMRKSTAGVSAIRFFYATGNILSGTINMYGIKNA